jgi:hypothetical protein
VFHSITAPSHGGRPAMTLARVDHDAFLDLVVIDGDSIASFPAAVTTTGTPAPSSPTPTPTPTVHRCLCHGDRILHYVFEPEPGECPPGFCPSGGCRNCVDGECPEGYGRIGTPTCGHGDPFCGRGASDPDCSCYAICPDTTPSATPTLGDQRGGEGGCSSLPPHGASFRGLALLSPVLAILAGRKRTSNRRSRRPPRRSSRPAP